MPFTIRRLRWILLGTSLVFLALVEGVRQWADPHLSTWGGRLLMDGVLLVGILSFFGVIFEIIARMQSRLEEQNRELLALHEAALGVHQELSLDKVLQKVVDQARGLLRARYGALSVVAGDGKIRQFVTSGISDELREKIGPPPQGRGLLGVVLNEGQRLRLRNLMTDERSGGFPEHHPPMHSLLAVPVPSKGPFRGNLYVAEKDGGEFDTEDEESLARFAVTAAMAIDKAYLHQRLQGLAVAEERVRIAREMHDGLAQVLAYVNTKAQAVKTLLGKQRTEEAAAQMEQLAGAAREVYTDVREGITALRTQLDGDRTLREALEEFIVTWRERSEIACELSFEGEAALSATVELQVLRIVQEALANVRKHSEATRVEVRVEVRAEVRAEAGEGLVVEVRDDGRGFDPDRRHRSDLPRFGLAVMRERAENVGGTLRLESAPGKGTRIRLELPFQEPGFIDSVGEFRAETERMGGT